MKFVTVGDLRTHPGEVWRQLDDEQELVLTSNGRPIALLVEIGEDQLEETLEAVRRARAQVAASNMRRHAASEGLDTLSEEIIEDEIVAARRARLR